VRGPERIGLTISAADAAGRAFMSGSFVVGAYSSDPNW
jgi:hypothetical protein